MLHKLLLYIHIVSAIMSIGPFFVLIPMVKKLRAAEASEQHVYIDSFRSAIRLAKHAGHVLVLSGVLLVIVGSWSWKSSWIVITILILVSSLYFLARAFSPKLRKLNEPGQDKGDLVRQLSRSIWIYLVLLMTMLWFMVAKPQLW
ncbi:DUF2269 family protein [Paenibacillus alkaliterrae]|uniref:DUF2269 family protein n=1 Tax=Paenibacillus alkaliterrae TaxID=320909 RepID=UPI001F18A69C|nr:DUF2269 family protein [Paenibacillus alkaliterrae]MCF2941313.1 DUF2269 family protein [Paenibacillus alkaliterrae]